MSFLDISQRRLAPQTRLISCFLVGNDACDQHAWGCSFGEYPSPNQHASDQWPPPPDAFFGSAFGFALGERFGISRLATPRRSVVLGFAPASPCPSPPPPWPSSAGAAAPSPLPCPAASAWPAESSPCPDAGFAASGIDECAKSNAADSACVSAGPRKKRSHVHKHAHQKIVFSVTQPTESRTVLLFPASGHESALMAGSLTRVAARPITPITKCAIDGLDDGTESRPTATFGSEIEGAGVGITFGGSAGGVTAFVSATGAFVSVSTTGADSAAGDCIIGWADTS